MKWIAEVLELQAPRSELSEEQSKRRGVEAQQLLEDPIIKDAFKGVARALLAAWIQSDPADAQLREMIFFQLRAVEKVHDNLTNMVTHGQILTQSAEQAEEEAQRSRGRGRTRDRPIEPRHR